MRFVCFQVKNTETFWKWLMNDTIPVLLFDPLDKTPNEGKNHFLTDGYTYLLGTAILRQQRTKPGCESVLTQKLYSSKLGSYFLDTLKSQNHQKGLNTCFQFPCLSSLFLLCGFAVVLFLGHERSVCLRSPQSCYRLCIRSISMHHLRFLLDLEKIEIFKL